MAAGRPHGYGTALVQLGERPEPRYADSQSRWPLPPRLPGRGSGHHQAAIRSSSDQRPAGRPPAESQPSAGGLTVSARGATPRNPPVAHGPVPSSRGLGRICPGERPPGTPRWPTARFLRYRAGAVFTRGSDPRNPPVAQGPVPSSRGLGRVYPGERPPGTSRWPVFTRGERPPEPRWPTARLARGALLSNPGWPKAPWCATGPSVVAGIRSRPGSRSPRARRRRRTWPSPGGCRWRSTGPRR